MSIAVSSAVVTPFARASDLSTGGYRRAPDAIAAILDAPAFPVPFVSPAHDVVLLATPYRPSASELARTVELPGGVRVDPVTNALAGAPTFAALQLLRIANGTTIDVQLAKGCRASAPIFSSDGARFAFAEEGPAGTELVTGTTATGELRAYPAVRLNPLLGDAVAWLPGGGSTLLLSVLDANRPAGPPPPPTGPVVRETAGTRARVPSQGLGPEDRGAGDRFGYYARGALAVLDLTTDRETALTASGIHAHAKASPDGKFVALDDVTEPISDAVPWQADAHRAIVVDRAGRTVAILPAVPVDANEDPAGAFAGPRDVAWQANAPSTLVWLAGTKAGGDTVYARNVATSEGARAVLGAAGRLDDLAFVRGSSLALAHEYERANKTSHTVEFDVDGRRDGARPEAFGAMRDGDAFADPGRPLTEPGPNGDPVAIRDGGAIFLSGEGYTTAGLRPFVDRVDLAARAKQRLFQSAIDPLETVVAMLDAHGEAYLVRRQSPSLPPDLFVRDVATHELRQLTHFVDPAPALRTLHPRIVSYKRADGVGCSFTLYLPPGPRDGTPLPTLMWAYPYEFDDRTAAGQNANFTQTFDEPHGAAARLAALAGFAVLDDVAMPIVGDTKTGSATLVAQLTMDAQAAIDEAVRLGATDRARVAVGGHSYGAFMAATLLAHTHLFRAGIARSGAYNRTLTPFGFQNEPRSYWEAPAVYAELSPFAYADRIASPLLLVHGERDENPATPALQSERLYDAIRGNGGTARLVLLPDEGHAYVSREATETVEAETIDFLKRYLGAARAPR